MVSGRRARRSSLDKARSSTGIILRLWRSIVHLNALHWLQIKFKTDTVHLDAKCVGRNIRSLQHSAMTAQVPRVIDTPPVWRILHRRDYQLCCASTDNAIRQARHVQDTHLRIHRAVEVVYSTHNLRQHQMEVHQISDSHELRLHGVVCDRNVSRHNLVFSEYDVCEVTFAVIS